MLSPEQVLPFLLHEHYDVRALTADYLADGHDTVPALVPVTADQFWESIDRCGMGRSVRLLSNLHKLPQTDASLSRALSALAAASDKDRDARAQMRYVLENVDF